MANETKVTFKKSDFLNNEQLAKHFGVPADAVLTVMKRHYKANTPITYKNGMRTIKSIMIIKDVPSHSNMNKTGTLTLHPMGMARFAELLAKELNKGK